MLYRKKNKRYGKKKRGFFASANLGPLGKYSVGYNKRSVKSVVRSIETAQHYYLTDATANVADMKQGTIYTLSLSSLIAQGTANNQRIGDEIFIEAIKINNKVMSAATSPTDNQTHLRFLIVKSSRQYNLSTWGSGLGISDIFLPGSYNLVTDAIIDPKRTTVILDKTCNIKPSIAGQRVMDHCQMTIPIKQKFVYNTNSAYGKFNNWYILAVAEQPGGAPGSTNVAGVYSNIDIIFKNSK